PASTPSSSPTATAPVTPSLPIPSRSQPPPRFSPRRCGWYSSVFEAGRSDRQPNHAANVGRRHPFCPERGKRGVTQRLRQLPAVAVEDQAVVVIARRGQVEQRLQQPMHAG